MSKTKETNPHPQMRLTGKRICKIDFDAEEAKTKEIRRGAHCG